MAHEPPAPRAVSERPALRRYIRRMLEGAHRPPLFEADDGHQYVLKLDTLDADFPVVELVAAHLAAALAVPLPAFVVAEAPPGLTGALKASGDPDLLEFAAAFERREGTCFGSRCLAGPTTRWTMATSAVDPQAAATLARVLVFDTFIENIDRTSASNPNLLISSGRVVAIDHNQALPVLQGATGKRLRFPVESHIAWPTVQADPHLLKAPIADLRALDPAAVRAAVAAVPACWWADPARAERAAADLIDRRAVVSDTLAAMQKSLS